MTPTLQASDLDVEAGAKALWLSRRGIKAHHDVRWNAIRDDASAQWAYTEAKAVIDAALQSLSAQLAAAERERDAARANAITFQQSAATILKAKQAAEANLLTATKARTELRQVLAYTREHLIFDPDSGEAIDVLAGPNDIGARIGRALSPESKDKGNG